MRSAEATFKSRKTVLIKFKVLALTASFFVRCAIRELLDLCLKCVDVQALQPKHSPTLHGDKKSGSSFIPKAAQTVHASSTCTERK